MRPTGLRDYRGILPHQPLPRREPTNTMAGEIQEEATAQVPSGHTLLCYQLVRCEKDKHHSGHPYCREAQDPGCKELGIFHCHCVMG
jgi:hypothetical protein